MIPPDHPVQESDKPSPPISHPKGALQGRVVSSQLSQGLHPVAVSAKSVFVNAFLSIVQSIGNRIIPSRRSGTQLEEFFETCKFHYWSDMYYDSEVLTELENMANLLLNTEPEMTLSKTTDVFRKLTQLAIGLETYRKPPEYIARSQAINDQVVNIYLNLFSTDDTYSEEGKNLGGYLQVLKAQNAAFSDPTNERIDKFIQDLGNREQKAFQLFEGAEHLTQKTNCLALHTGLMTRKIDKSSFREDIHPHIFLDAEPSAFTELLTHKHIQSRLVNRHIVIDLVSFWAPKCIDENHYDPPSIAKYCNRMVNISKLHSLSTGIDDKDTDFVKLIISRLDTHVLEQLSASKLFPVFRDIVTETLSLRNSTESTEVHVKQVLDLMQKRVIPEKKHEPMNRSLESYLSAIGPQKTREVIKALLTNKSYNDKSLNLQLLIDAVMASEYIAYNNGHNIIITSTGVQKIIEGLVAKGTCATGEIEMLSAIDTLGPALDRFYEQKANSCHLIIGYERLNVQSHLTPIHVKRNTDGTCVFIITDSTGVEGFHQPSRTFYVYLVKNALQKWCEERKIQGQIYALELKRQHDSTNCPVFSIRDCIEAKRHLDALVTHVQKTATHIDSNYYQFTDPIPCLMKGAQSLKQLDSYRKQHPEAVQLTETVAKHTDQERNLYAADRFHKYTMLLMMDILGRSLSSEVSQ